MTSNSLESLNNAIEGLYDVFKGYRLRPHIEGCPCCVDENDQARVRSRPLRELTSDDLGPIAMNALTTWGEVSDLKHFLPRLLELVATDSECMFETEILIGKLHDGVWTNWSTAEQVALNAYFDAWWDDVLEAFPSRSAVVDADSCLCSMAQALGQLTPTLERWRDCESPAAVRHLAQSVEINFESLRKNNTLRNPFWESRHHQMNQMRIPAEPPSAYGLGF